MQALKAINQATKQKMKHKIEFNTGFVSAIALFLEHKNLTEHMPKDKTGKVICDLRLYGATDHLYDLEINKKTPIPYKLGKRICKWRAKCFHHRMDHLTETKIADALFKEAEDILAQIDKQVFRTKKVIMRYR